jgi:hypothetical protein
MERYRIGNFNSKSLRKGGNFLSVTELEHRWRKKRRN